MHKAFAAAVPALSISLLAAVQSPAWASAPGCGQAQVEKLLGAPAPPAPSAHYIVPNAIVAPIYQWESNNGYCGEVSQMSAGLASGQWMSQYNARMVCGGFFGSEANGYGASLEQAGNPAGRNGNYNAELLIENPDQGLSGPYDYDWAERCAANAGLALTQYPSTTGYQKPNSGLSGYQDFLSWIKGQIIAGHQVTLGVMLPKAAGGSDPQYDHIVNVIKIGTNHSPTDPSYYADDVLYFDDHGVYTLKLNARGVWSFTSNPSTPPGAGSDTEGCTPYIFGYTFASLVKTRAEANAANAPAYEVVLPDANTTVKSNTGNDSANGDGTTPVPGPHNAGFAISGPIDTLHETVPVSLAIVGTSTLTNGVWTANPADENSSPAAGYNYENPYIGGPVGTCDHSNCISNVQPAAMQMTFQATLRGLSAGTTYNLYEYDFPTQGGADTGTAAALTIPTANFNKLSSMATSKTTLVATGPTYSTATFTRMSDQIVVFRAVPANAP